MTAVLTLAAIRRDGGTQPRDHVSMEVAKDYAEAIGMGAAFPPVVAFFDGTDHWLADGFHRALAHELIERPEIEAEVHQGTRRDAILYSVGANAAHGYRRTNADKRRAVLTLLNDEEWAAWSDREVGRRCGVSGPMVASLRPKPVTSRVCSEPVRTYQDRHGNTSTMKVGAIGPAAARAELPPIAGRRPDRKPDTRGMPKLGTCSIGSAARITGFSAERLAGFARAGEIAGARKEAGSWVFDIEPLRAWMKGQPAIGSVETAPEPLAAPPAAAEPAPPRPPAIPATTPAQQALIQRLIALFADFHELSTAGTALHAWSLFRGQDIPPASVHAAGAWMAEFVARFPVVDAERQLAVEAMLEKVEADVVG